MSEILLYDLGEEGRAWTRRCLASGRELSRRILGDVELADGATFLAGLASESAPALAGRSLEHGFDDPSVVSLTRASESLFELLREPGAAATSVIVVEDDLRSPGDPRLRRPLMGSVHYLGRVPLHVNSLASIESPAVLTRFLETSASGYPLNGFALLDGRAEDLQTRLTDGNAGELSKSLTAIINAAFDGEAYSVWLPRYPRLQSAPYP